LLIFINIAYIVLVPVFLLSEKISTGSFVPHPGLYFVYGPVALINFFSALYNLTVLKNNKSIIPQWLWERLIHNREKTDFLIGWASLVSIMIMSFCNIIGFGNPSNDPILTDFALAHSLIILAVVIIGRKIALIWFLVVVAVLIYDVSSLGWDYQYHYLTPVEVSRYKLALENKQDWALKREVALTRNRLNPPKITRYFNVWMIFIIVAFLTAYFFSGLSHDILNIVPSVVHNIEAAIQSSSRIELEREREKRILEEEKRLAKEQEFLIEKEALRTELAFLKVQFNPHFLYNTLNYLYAKAIPVSEELADGILNLSDIMRYALKESTDSRVPLQEEIDHLRQLIDLHQARFSHTLHVAMQVEGDPAPARILPLVLLSFVENAFKHGNLTQEADPLLIHLSIANEQITFYIQNRKSRSQSTTSTYIGNQNVQRRLELAYADKHRLHIREDEHYYRCELIIQA